MSTQSIINYIELIRLQQSYNLDRPKLDSLINSFSPFYTESEAISEVLNLPYTLLSCKQFDSNYYWEFILNNNITEFKNFKFIYILANLTNFNLLKSKLPYFYSWDINKQVNLIYLNKPYYLDTDASSWGQSYFINLAKGFKHSFLPTWEFTGYIVLSNTQILYEYVDTLGWCTPKELKYLSPLRPSNLNFPLGYPNSNSLTLDDCYNQDLNLYPNTGDSYFAGKYIGQYTNSLYNKHIKFWLYQNSNATFLLEYPPAHNTESSGLSAIYQANNQAKIRLFTESTSSFTLTQTSNNSKIHF
jgi:hypothetical protein